MSDNLPHMDYRQHRRARRLVHECCNYDGGNCLLLDDGEPCVCVQSIALILNDLAASFEGRNEYISRLCRYPLLILDDFGMERGTEYGLEQVFNVIDSRYRSGKPLIVTTNLTLDDLHNPEDTAHSRIYDRLLSMCVPVRFTGDNFRQETAKRKMESMKKLITD